MPLILKSVQDHSLKSGWFLSIYQPQIKPSYSLLTVQEQTLTRLLRRQRRLQVSVPSPPTIRQLVIVCWNVFASDGKKRTPNPWCRQCLRRSIKLEYEKLSKNPTVMAGHPLGDSAPALTKATYGCGSKFSHQGTAGFSLWFHLPGFHFGYPQPSPLAGQLAGLLLGLGGSSLLHPEHILA